MAPVSRTLVATCSGDGLSSTEKSVGARSSTGPSPSSSVVVVSGGFTAEKDGCGSGSARRAVEGRPAGRARPPAEGKGWCGEKHWRQRRRRRGEHWNESMVGGSGTEVGSSSRRERERIMGGRNRRSTVQYN